MAEAIVNAPLYQGYINSWVEIAPNLEQNFPQPFSGNIIREWWADGKDYMQLEGGRVYRRPDCYDSNSPYGWERTI